MSITQSQDRTIRIYPDFEIVFVMDPLHRLDLGADGSLRLMQAFQDLNHVVYWTESSACFIEQGKVYASVSLVVDTHPLKLGPPHIVLLDEVDGLIHRTSPPMDGNFVHMTHMLKFVSAEVFQFNSPRGLRDADENLLGMNWPELMPPTVATMDFVGLYSFLKLHRRVVLKPSGGGSGDTVQLLDVDAGDFENKLNVLKKNWTNAPAYWVAQKYLPAVSEGQKNIFIVNGKPVGAVNIFPEAGQFFAEGSKEGRVEQVDLDERDHFLVAEIVPTLARWGLSFICLHVIGGMITKIKVMNPAPVPLTGVAAEDQLDAQIAAAMVQQIQKGRSPVFQMKPGCC